MALIDFTALPAQPTAEHARSLRQTRVVDAHQGGRVVCPHRHPRLDDRAAMACVGEAPGPTTQQARPEAFDHGAAVATRLVGGAPGTGPCGGARPPRPVAA